MTPQKAARIGAGREKGVERYLRALKLHTGHFGNNPPCGRGLQMMRNSHPPRGVMQRKRLLNWCEIFVDVDLVKTSLKAITSFRCC